MNMQHLYLKAMGIEVWQLRSSPPKASENLGKILELLNKQGDCLAYLLTSSSPHCLQQEALKLLDAMLAAIDLQRSSGSVFDVSLLASKQPRPILLLGERLAQNFLRTQLTVGILRGQCHYPNTYPQFAVFPSFGIEEVLANPKLKRPVWEDLCLFKNYIEQHQLF